jgi:hypothetical protein
MHSQIAVRKKERGEYGKLLIEGTDGLVGGLSEVLVRRRWQSVQRKAFRPPRPSLEPVVHHEHLPDHPPLRVRERRADELHYEKRSDLQRDGGGEEETRNRDRAGEERYPEP